jgi:hypothetical protein
MTPAHAGAGFPLDEDGFAAALDRGDDALVVGERRIALSRKALAQAAAAAPVAKAQAVWQQAQCFHRHQLGVAMDHNDTRTTPVPAYDVGLGLRVLATSGVFETLGCQPPPPTPPPTPKPLATTVSTRPQPQKYQLRPLGTGH